MKKIILQNDNQSLLQRVKAFLNTLSKNANIYESFTEEEINIIKDNVIDLSEENNSWKEIYRPSSEQYSDDAQTESDDAIIFESECNKLLKQIKLFNQGAASLNTGDSQQGSQTNAPASSKQTQDDIDQKLNAAESQATENTITLIVTSKNNFEFVNNKNEKFQSKESLEKLESFLKAHKEILKAAIDAALKQKNENKERNISEAVNFISSTMMIKSKTLKAFKDKLNITELTNILKTIDKNNQIWEKVTTRYNFGDEIADRNEIQKMFYIILGSLICCISAINLAAAQKSQEQIDQEKFKNNTDGFRTRKQDEFKNDIKAALDKCNFSLVAKACDVDGDGDDAELAENEPLYGWNNEVLARWDIDEQIDHASQVNALQKFLKGQYNVANADNKPPHPSSIITIIAKLQQSLNKWLQEDEIEQSDVEKFKNAAAQPCKLLQAVADKYKNFFPLN